MKELSKKESIIVLLLLLIICIAMFFLGWYIGFRGIRLWVPQKQELTKQDILDSIDLIAHNYDGEVHETVLVQNTIQSLVNSLGDQNSYYVSKEEYSQYRSMRSGTYAGIGMLYSYNDGIVRVTHVFDDSPAQRAGITPGQRVTSIHSTDVSSIKNAIELINLFKGKEGEPIQLTLRNEQNSEPITVTLTRELIAVPSSSFMTMENNITLLTVYQFGESLSDELKAVKDQIAASDGLIIDLRNNSGGIAQVGIAFADEFLKKGIILQDQLADESKPVLHTATENDTIPDIPIVVLVNSHTASAAEFVTAAIQDNLRGTVIGETTYGKGKVGNFYELRDGSAIHLTIGHWFTPNGKTIEGTGITPDVTVEDLKENDTDAILEKALNLLSDQHSQQ